MNRPTIVFGRRGLRAIQLMGITAVAMLLLGYGMYELGLRQAGFNRMDTIAVVSSLRTENKALKRRNKKLSEQVAILETAGKIDQAAYRYIESELAELQSRILQQQEELEFYAGIVTEGGTPGVRIQEFRVLPGRTEREFELRIILAQAFRSDRQVAGDVDVSLSGLQGSETVRLGLAELQPDGATGVDLSFSFRYFQDLRASLTLPPDFVPERVNIRLSPASAQTVEESFVWIVEQG